MNDEEWSNSGKSLQVEPIGPSDELGVQRARIMPIKALS